MRSVPPPCALIIHQTWTWTWIMPATAHALPFNLVSHTYLDIRIVGHTRVRSRRRRRRCRCRRMLGAYLGGSPSARSARFRGQV